MSEKSKAAVGKRQEARMAEIVKAGQEFGRPFKTPPVPKARKPKK